MSEHAARAPRRAVLYARVSTGGNTTDPEELAKQNPETQLRALREYATRREWAVAGEYTDRITGDVERRRRPGDPPGLAKALEALRRQPRGGGKPVLLLFSAERIARHPITLLSTVQRIQGAPYEADVCSVVDGRDLDTTDDTNELMLYLKGWFARMWLRLMRAGTVEGIKRARAAGKRIGRPPALTADQQAQVRALRAAGRSWREVAAAVGCTVGTARRAAGTGVPDTTCAPDGAAPVSPPLPQVTVSGTG